MPGVSSPLGPHSPPRPQVQLPDPFSSPLLPGAARIPSPAGGHAGLQGGMGGRGGGEGAVRREKGGEGARAGGIKGRVALHLGPPFISSPPLPGAVLHPGSGTQGRLLRSSCPHHRTSTGGGGGGDGGKKGCVCACEWWGRERRGRGIGPCSSGPVISPAADGRRSPPHFLHTYLMPRALRPPHRRTAHRHQLLPWKLQQQRRRQLPDPPRAEAVRWAGTAMMTGVAVRLYGSSS